MAEKYTNSFASIIVLGLPLFLIFILGSKYIHEEENDRRIISKLNRPEILIQNQKITTFLIENNNNNNSNSALNCTWPALKLRSKEGPLTALASKPGSGNTWVRHLLQLATGIQTGSIFNEQRLKRNGFPGEGIVNGSVIAIKTHNLRTLYDRYIVIIRDPFKAALAEYNRVNSWRQNKEKSHTGHAYMEEFKNSAWPRFVKVYFKGWIEFCDGVLKLNSSQVCLLIYENLVQDVVKELKPCVEFLGFEIDKHLAKCIKKDKEGSFHRSAMAEDELKQIFTKPFSKEEINVYNRTTHNKISALMKHSVNHRLKIK